MPNQGQTIDTLHAHKYRWTLNANLLAGLAVACGVLGLLGWIFDNSFLRSFLSDGASMKVNTALMIIFSGLSLFFLNYTNKQYTRVLAFVSAVLGLAIIFEYIFNLNLHFDNALFFDRFTNPAVEPPGRPSLLTALNMLLVNLAVILLSYRRFYAGQLTAFCSAIIIYISLMGHVFHISGFYHLGVYSGIAFHTALALLLIAVGSILSSPQHGWISLVYRRLNNKNVFLYLLSYFLGAAPLFAAIYLFVIQHGRLSPSSDIVVLVAITAILSLPVAYFLLRFINRMNVDLNITGQKLEIALSASRLGSYDLDLSSGIISSSAQFKELYGISPEVRFSLSQLLDMITPAHRQEVKQKMDEAISRRSIYKAEYQVCWADGSVHWLSASGKPQYDEDGNATAIIGVTFETTEQKLADDNKAMIADEIAAFNEELTAANEELAAVNEEQAATNEELIALHNDLRKSVEEQVKATNAVEHAEEMLRLSIEAGKVGTWNIEPQTKALKYNDTLAKIFGYQGAESMTYDQAIGQVTDEHRPKIIEAIAEAIANGGNYDITYTQRRFNDDEVIWLRSLGRVRKDEDGEYSLFSGVVMDITEQKKDDQRKSDFIGIVSHELKTPLTSLSAYIQLLQLYAKKNEDKFAANSLDKAHKQIGKMNTMINGFLDVSRLEAGKMQIDKQYFDMATLIKDIEEESVASISSHHVVFASIKPIFIDADRDKIGHVINNLISNAVKYSPARTTISIGCTTRNGTVVVSVRDQGIGIAESDGKRLFERYYRVESEYTKSISGFGIGLYLSAEIIKRHHGKIWLESELNKGSTFYFSVPLAKQIDNC